MPVEWCMDSDFCKQYTFIKKTKQIVTYQEVATLRGKVNTYIDQVDCENFKHRYRETTDKKFDGWSDFDLTNAGSIRPVMDNWC